MPSIQDFNRLPDDAVRQALRRCCSSGRWIDAVVAGRPYRDLDALLAASDAAVATLTEADLGEAMAGHPRIGERREPAGWSGQEQAGVRGADDELRRALAEGNAAYEQRFGHIYLACATGWDAAELLALLRSRLGNDRATEWGVVASELAKINRIRLRKLLDLETVGAVPGSAGSPAGTGTADGIRAASST